MTYAFDLLLPSRHPNAGTNAAKLGQWTFGVEVTDPFLAQQCGLGNLDPQHDSDCASDLSAIEAALLCDLPPPSATLATIRADSDAIGAMAVLSLRAMGREISAEARARIELVGKWDRFDQGQWADWRATHRPLPPIARTIDLGGPPIFIQSLGFIARASNLSVEDRVRLFEAWILHASLPSFALQGAAKDGHAQLSAWNQGQIAIESTDDDRIIIVRSQTPFGLRIGYRHAPIVIAEGTLSTGRKLTVAQFDRGHINMTQLVARLNVLETGWGGSATIIGSPQGAACGLPLKDVRDLATELLAEDG